MKAIDVTKYNSDWPRMFESEAKLIKEVVGDNCLEIHHIGSTSVPELLAKPIIDIIASANNTTKAIKELESIGYRYKGEYNIPFRFFLSKDGENNESAVHLHLFEAGNPEIELNLLFRDYLRKHLEVQKEYADLKTNLLTKEDSYQKNAMGFTGYNLGKDAFITNILEKAGFNRLCLRFCNHRKEWENYHRIREEQIFRPIGIAYDRNHPSLTHSDTFHFILYKGTIIVAAASVEFLNKTDAALRTIAVDPAHQNHGFGTHMMLLLEKWIKSQGRGVVKMHARLSAESFYRKLGYIPMEFNDIAMTSNVIDLGKVL